MDVDFNKYYGILREEHIVVPGHRMDFFDIRLGKKVQVTNQMTFRTFVIFQVAQRVEMITFTSEPIGKNAMSETDGGILNFSLSQAGACPSYILSYEPSTTRIIASSLRIFRQALCTHGFPH